MAFSAIASVLGPALSTAAQGYMEATDELSDTNVKRRKAAAEKELLPLQTAVEAQGLQRQLKSPHGKVVSVQHDAAGNWVSRYEDGHMEHTTYGGAAGGGKETAWTKRIREIGALLHSEDANLRAMAQGQMAQLTNHDPKEFQVLQRFMGQLKRYQETGEPIDPELVEWEAQKRQRLQYEPPASGQAPLQRPVTLPGGYPSPGAATAPAAPAVPAAPRVPAAPGQTQRAPTASQQQVLSLVDAAAESWGVPPALARAVVQEETTAGQNNRTSSAGARGAMQLMPETIRRASQALNIPEDEIINDDAANIYAGVWWLKQGLKNHNNNVDLALYDYNHDYKYVQRVKDRMGQKTPPVAEASPPTAPTTPEQAAAWRAQQPGATVPFDAQFNTRLTPQEEQAFQQWKAQYAPRDSGADYDLRGAFKAGLKPDPQSGHWPDTFKKPNHPTFSDQSRYAQYGTPGRWQGQQFIPPTATTPAPVQRMPAPTVPGTLPPLAPGATRGYQRKEAGLPGPTREQAAAATTLYNEGKLPSAQLIGGEIDIGALPPAERGLIDAHVAETKNQAGLGRTLQRARPYLGQLASLEESEGLVKMIEPLITEDNVGPRGWTTSFLQDLGQQMHFLDAGTKAKLFNANIPRLEVLSHALAYIHANAIKSTAAGGGSQRGVQDRDIERVEAWFAPLGLRASPAKLKAQIQGVRDLIESQRKPAERMLQHMNLDKTGAPLPGKRFEHEPGLTGNEILGAPDPAEEGTP